MNQDQYNRLVLRLNVIVAFLLAIAFCMGITFGVFIKNQENICDMNGDGNFTILDLSILSRVISEK